MSCETPSTFAPRSLAEVIEEYHARYAANAKAEHTFFKSMPSLATAIRIAALARTPDDRRQPHQRRIAASVLARSEGALQTARRDLRAARSFDNVHRIVDETIGRIRGIGELTVYDTSTRIGAFLGLAPTSVYLHAGVRAGAKALGLDTRRAKIPMSELPPPLRSLAPAAVEDILCIFKDSPAFRRHASDASRTA